MEENKVYEHPHVSRSWIAQSDKDYFGTYHCYECNQIVEEEE